MSKYHVGQEGYRIDGAVYTHFQDAINHQNSTGGSIEIVVWNGERWEPQKPGVYGLSSR